MANCKDACVKDRDASWSPARAGAGAGAQSTSPFLPFGKSWGGQNLDMLDLTTDVYGKRVTTRFASQVEGVWRQRKLCYK